MMRLAVVVLAALVPSTFTLPAPARAAETDATSEMVLGAIEDAIRPAYRDFAATSARLLDDMASLCNAPGSETLAEARSAFRNAAVAWSVAEMVRFGPVREDNRLERILFWPDRRSIGLKQVQALLATKDETATNAEALSGKSVAVQGLGALEFVLFGTGAEELYSEAGFRCSYGSAIATNIAGIATALETEWTEAERVAASWTEPGPDNAAWRDDAEALGELADILIHGLELVRDVRISGFLGETPNEDRSKRALFWRSEVTVASMRANVEALANIFESAGFDGHLGPDEGWVADSIRFEFDNAISTLKAIDAPVEALVSNPESRQKLAYVRVVTSTLSNLVGRQLTGAFGLTAGFSSLDGD